MELINQSKHIHTAPSVVTANQWRIDCKSGRDVHCRQCQRVRLKNKYEMYSTIARRRQTTMCYDLRQLPRLPVRNDVAAIGYTKWRHDRHLESVTSYPKSDSVNRCVFTQGTIMPNFIPIGFETTELFGRGRPNKKNNKISSDMGPVLDPKYWKVQRSSAIYTVCMMVKVSLTNQRQFSGITYALGERLFDS